MKLKTHLARGASLRGLARHIRGEKVAPRDRERRGGERPLCVCVRVSE